MEKSIAKDVLTMAKKMQFGCDVRKTHPRKNGEVWLCDIKAEGK
jgi:hypothetical protein